MFVCLYAAYASVFVKMNALSRTSVHDCEPPELTGLFIPLKTRSCNPCQGLTGYRNV